MLPDSANKIGMKVQTRVGDSHVKAFLLSQKIKLQGDTIDEIIKSINVWNIWIIIVKFNFKATGRNSCRYFLFLLPLGLSPPGSTRGRKKALANKLVETSSKGNINECNILKRKFYERKHTKGQKLL